MKILHIGKFYLPINGGIESINHLIVEALKSNQQRVVSFNDSNVSTDEDVDGVPVIRASTKWNVSSQPLSWRYFIELKRAIKFFNPHIIHLHYPNPLAAAYLLYSIRANHKLIVHWHSDIVAQRFLKPIVKPLEDKLLKRADAIIATSPSYVEASDNLRQFKNKVTVIPCSIDETNFNLRDGDQRKVESIKLRFGNRPIIFYVGRHVEYKGIAYLMEAEKLVKHDCVFVIAGSGPLTQQLKKQCNSERIYWVGRVSDEEMRQYLYASSIFAFPSITRNEAFGVALAEAMYCKCPAITFTVPGSGVNWVSINNVTGIEVKNRDVGAFAQAIDDLLMDDGKRSIFSQNAHYRVTTRFTKDIVIPQYLNLYNKLYMSKRDK